MNATSFRDKQMAILAKMIIKEKTKQKKKTNKQKKKKKKKKKKKQQQKQTKLNQIIYKILMH